VSKVEGYDGQGSVHRDSELRFPAIVENELTEGEKEVNLRSKFSVLVLTVILSVGVLAVPTSRQSADIVDTAVAAGNFTTLAKALQVAGLIDTLKGAGPFTVFAPTDEAFAKLPAGTVEALLKDPAKLKSILLYHVVAGRVPAKDVVKLKSARTVQGSSARINVAAGKVMIDQANVVKTDIMASNGVIHVIDSVIVPK